MQHADERGEQTVELFTNPIEFIIWNTVLFLIIIAFFAFFIYEKCREKKIRITVKRRQITDEKLTRQINSDKEKLRELTKKNTAAIEANNLTLDDVDPVDPDDAAFSSMLTIFSPFRRKKVKGEHTTTSEVQFSAVAPAVLPCKKYALIHIVMHEESFRYVVDELTERYGRDRIMETRSGVVSVDQETSVRVVLSSPEIEIDDNSMTQLWCGKYLIFPYGIKLSEDFDGEDILFTADIYFNDVPASKLKFVVQCESDSHKEQKPAVLRSDILSAFVSYASQDRARVASVIQGMQKARPELDIFFDVENLRSGVDWEKALQSEILSRDILFLCWSHFASQSEWVDYEWRYAAENKGVECIEPIPLESPDKCPPPAELNSKHFNDRLLFIINAK